MNKIGQCNIQYARNFFAEQKLVLGVDRASGKNPFAEVFADDTRQEMVVIIKNDITIENMYSDPKKGAKTRTDIYFNTDHLSQLKQILDNFVVALQQQNINFDTSTRSTPDPTGTEYPGGLKLGEIQIITWIGACVVEANYYDKSFKIHTAQTKIYIDAENCNKGPRLHFGIGNMNATVVDVDQSENQNCFIIKINYNQLKRFSNAVNVAINWLV